MVVNFWLPRNQYFLLITCLHEFPPFFWLKFSYTLSVWWYDSMKIGSLLYGFSWCSIRLSLPVIVCYTNQTLSSFFFLYLYTHSIVFWCLVGWSFLLWCYDNDLCFLFFNNWTPFTAEFCYSLYTSDMFTWSCLYDFIQSNFVKYINMLHLHVQWSCFASTYDSMWSLSSHIMIIWWLIPLRRCNK